MITFEALQPDAIKFISDRTGMDFSIANFESPVWVCATSRSPEGSVDGVLLGEFTSWFEVHMTTAVDNPRILSRRLLNAIFSTFFSRAVRVTVMTRPENERSVSGIKRLGFHYEGFSRLGIDGKWDGLVFGMLKHECPWIRPKEYAHGKSAKAA